MSIILDLTPTEEAELSNKAMQGGIAPEELATKLVRQGLRQETPLSNRDAVRAKLRQWQQETATETSPDISARELFRGWAEEDAGMTDEERRAESELWEAVQQGINENRVVLGTRAL